MGGTLLNFVYDLKALFLAFYLVNMDCLILCKSCKL